MAAINWWEKTTCIKFIPRTSQHDYIYIQSTDYGCYSDTVGHSGRKQVLNIQEIGCSRTGTIAHEFGHNLGLWHEQSRYDRDEYIKVHIENIKKADINNFDKLTKKDLNVQGLPYDYDSIMHYKANSFSKNGKDTIEIIENKLYKDQGAPAIGQRDHLSKGDIAVINKLYKCK